MNKFRLKFLLLILLLSLLIPSGIVKAQTTPTPGPVYIVQEGDSLWVIASRFHISPTDLADANGISNANQITIGQQLVIPGMEGIHGVLTTEDVPYGETLSSLSLRYHISVELLEKLNQITSPNELYAGYSLIILQNDNTPSLGKRTSLSAGQSLLELSILNDTNPWAILATNQLDNSSSIIPGDVIRLPGSTDNGPGALPSSIKSIKVSGLTQGTTTEIQIEGTSGASLQGSFMDHMLNFFSDAENHYVALQGVYAMAEPGVYPLNIKGTSSDGSVFNYTQNVLVLAGKFRIDNPLTVDPATLDPAVTGPEDKLWLKLSTPATPDKFWQGKFSIPVEPVHANCYMSLYGSRRSYNGSAYIYYHTGLDYCGQIGEPVYAAASGVVVFTGPLTVRGNATMIDIGWGVYTAYLHQSEILVKVGDHVEQGQLIGKVGNTGRVEGPHLHFEVLVGGIPVNPLDWLSQAFP